MKSLFKNLNLSITPNSAPTWSGSFPAVLYDSSIKVITTVVPLTQTDETSYVDVELELWVDSSEIVSEKSIRLNGVPYSVRPLIKLSKPVAITPCRKVLYADGDENNDTYELLLAETFEESVYALFDDTGWSIKIDPQGILNLPVVTEVAPVLTLNGSKLEQLSQLLGVLSPSDLWGQSLSFFVNIFENEILITSPLHGDSNVNTVSLDELKPDELNVRKTHMDLPGTIIIQELESSLLRVQEHFDNTGVDLKTYSFETSQVVTDEDSDETTINASVTGERFTVGGLVLTETDSVLINQSTVKSMKLGFGGPFNDAAKYSKYRITKDQVSEVTTTVEYEYLLGPPYITDEAVLYDPYMEDGSNRCFSKSLPMTRQQLARDYGTIAINKDAYPSHLGTTDGIRVSKKKVITEELSTDTTSFEASKTENYNFPGPDVPDNTVTTTVEEVYMYDDDGNLTGSRSLKTASSKDGSTVTNVLQFLTPISEQITGALTYTVETKYNSVGEVITSSVTDVRVDTIPAAQSGPNTESVSASVEGTTTLRELVYKIYTGQSVTKLNTNGTTTPITEIPGGVLYVSVENLTIEEIQEYLDMYYSVGATTAFYVSLSSKFVDVRGIIGGHLKLTGTTLNRPELYDLTDMTKLELQDSGFLEAIDATPFRVTGISMDWGGDAIPDISLAMCQLI